MISLGNVVSFIAVVVLTIILDVYCGDISAVRHNAVNNTFNPWPKLPSQSNNQREQQSNNGKSWPALGQQYVNPPVGAPTWVNRPRFNEQTRTNRFPNRVSQYVGPGFESRAADSSPTIKSGPVNDDELREFAETLLTKDSNNAARYVRVNFQGKTTSRSQHDEAPSPLLDIDRQAFTIPSVQKLMLLYNNYVLESSQNEHYTPQEKTEENDLLDVTLSTPVMQYTRNFLIQKGKLGRDPKEFRDTLKEIWFNMYSRGGGRIGSSGFEHVFLTEIKNNQISGLHNWLYFNEMEKQNEANYLGYLKKIDLGNKGAILKFHFTFHGIDKPVGSMFIGTSPELEIALYTTCFLLRADQVCPLKLNNNRFIIRTYTYRYRGRNMIGSAFPEI